MDGIKRKYHRYFKCLVCNKRLIREMVEVEVPDTTENFNCDCNIYQDYALENGISLATFLRMPRPERIRMSPRVPREKICIPGEGWMLKELDPYGEVPADRLDALGAWDLPKDMVLEKKMICYFCLNNSPALIMLDRCLPIAD
jgi:hypothetical protein